MGQSLQFFSEDISYSLSDERKTCHWILSAISKEGYSLESINYVFCNDKYLHQINVEYLNHDTLTDIITFSYSEQDDSPILGDIYISIERVQENAKLYGNQNFEHELNRVIIHGVLHLCGYQDKTNDQQKEMTEKENYYLRILENI